MNDEYLRSIGSALEGAAANLPDNYELRICVEHGAAWVQLFDHLGEEIDLECPDGGLPSEIEHALDVAKHWWRQAEIS